MRVLSRLLFTLSLLPPLLGVPLLTAGPAQALDNDLARTPPMGWNSWNTFGCNATEQIVKDTADFMVSSGMRDAGYQYLTIDDCWMERSRDSEGRLVPDAAKYPHGLAELAAYVHGKGLKFGVYESPTYHTCQGFPGSLGYEQKDADTFASWGVDFLKYDNCTASDPDQRPGDEKLPLEARDSTMRDALERTGRPIVFSLSLQPAAQGESPWERGKSVANMWRIDGDRDASFDGLRRLIHTDLDKAKWAGPGGWNDIDMLGTGNYAFASGSNDPNKRLTYDQEKSELSVAAVLAAPLISGADLRTRGRRQFRLPHQRPGRERLPQQGRHRRRSGQPWRTGHCGHHRERPERAASPPGQRRRRRGPVQRNVLPGRHLHHRSGRRPPGEQRRLPPQRPVGAHQPRQHRRHHQRHRSGRRHRALPGEPAPPATNAPGSR